MSNATTCPQPEFFQSRVILAPLNNSVHNLNQKILSLLPGEEHCYHSADTQSFKTSIDDEDAQPVPVELLQAFNASGLPLSQLHHVS